MQTCWYMASGRWNGFCHQNRAVFSKGNVILLSSWLFGVLLTDLMEIEYHTLLGRKINGPTALGYCHSYSSCGSERTWVKKTFTNTICKSYYMEKSFFFLVLDWSVLLPSSQQGVLWYFKHRWHMCMSIWFQQSHIILCKLAMLQVRLYNYRVGVFLLQNSYFWKSCC